MLYITTEAKYIPDSMMVCKPTGEKKYKLCKQGLRLYRRDGQPVEVIGEGLLFLIDPHNPTALNAVKPETLLKVQVNPGESSVAQNLIDAALCEDDDYDEPWEED